MKTNRLKLIMRSIRSVIKYIDFTWDWTSLLLNDLTTLLLSTIQSHQNEKVLKAKMLLLESYVGSPLVKVSTPLSFVGDNQQKIFSLLFSSSSPCSMSIRDHISYFSPKACFSQKSYSTPSSILTELIFFLVLLYSAKCVNLT